jgi:TolA-binding protein
MPREPSAEEIEAAQTLLAQAQKHHFSKQFQEARAIYKQIVERYGDTKQATVARQQIENLRNA